MWLWKEGLSAIKEEWVEFYFCSCKFSKGGIWHNTWILVTILASGEEVEKLPCGENNGNQTEGARGSSIQFYYAFNLLTEYIRDKTGVTGNTLESLKSISRCFFVCFQWETIEDFQITTSLAWMTKEILLLFPEIVGTKDVPIWEAVYVFRMGSGESFLECSIQTGGDAIPEIVSEVGALAVSVFSKESALCIRWPKYWSFSFNNSLKKKFIYSCAGSSLTGTDFL